MFFSKVKQLRQDGFKLNPVSLFKKISIDFILCSCFLDTRDAMMNKTKSLLYMTYILYMGGWRMSDNNMFYDE